MAWKIQEELQETMVQRIGHDLSPTWPAGRDVMEHSRTSQQMIRQQGTSYHIYYLNVLNTGLKQEIKQTKNEFLTFVCFQCMELSRKVTLILTWP